MIEVQNLCKSFENFEALKNVSINVNKGSIYGLLGCNGAGKTTLLKTLAGIYRQDSGNIFIDTEPVYENEKSKAKFVFLPDAVYFFPGYTIKDMAKFYKGIYSTWNEERFEKLRQAFRIDIKKKIQKLSKGLQKQVAFWLALSAMPELLILDEPFDGLDTVMRQQIRNLLVQDVAERQLTIIVSSHNLRELEDLCDSVCLLHKGSIVVEKDLDALKSDLHKVQLGFKDIGKEIDCKSFQILHREKIGGIQNFILRGDREFIIEEFKKYNPTIFDILPLSLEEIFIYEMEDLGYEVENIII